MIALKNISNIDIRNKTDMLWEFQSHAGDDYNLNLLWIYEHN